MLHILLGLRCTIVTFQLYSYRTPAALIPLEHQMVPSSSAHQPRHVSVPIVGLNLAHPAELWAEFLNARTHPRAMDWCDRSSSIDHRARICDVQVCGWRHVCPPRYRYLSCCGYEIRDRNDTTWHCCAPHTAYAG